MIKGDKPVEVIGRAVQDANVTNQADRLAGPGVTRDTVIMSDEDSMHIAHEVLKALEDAGYVIVKNAGANDNA